MEKKLLKRFEEMDETEQGKLKELLKDSKNDESDGNKLSWMYKDKADNEEYLLGRRVDSGVIITEPDNTDSAGALFNEVITRRSELDMQVKMREDPLYAIRKREEEVKRRLLENPIKMKQLQKVVEEQKKQHKHKDKKKKKTKKHRKRSQSESSSSSDDELLKKYLAVVGNKDSGSKTDITGSGQRSEIESRTGQRSEIESRTGQRSGKDQGSATENHISMKNEGKSERMSHRDEQKSRRQHSSSRDRQHRDDKHKHRHNSNNHGDEQNDESSQRDRQRERDSSRDDVRQRDRQRDGNDKQTIDTTLQDDTQTTRTNDELKQQQKLVGYGLITTSRYQPRLQQPNNIESNKNSNKETKQTSSSKSDASVSSRPAVKRKLTEQEMTAKREAMMRNARERDEEREQNVKRYKAEDERESKAQEKHTTAAFVKPMIMKHATESSVEDRLKRNVYNIQRTANDLDKNFTKR